MTYTSKSLYKICLKEVENLVIRGWSHKFNERELRSLPNNILFDCYYEIYLGNHLCLLGWELGDVNILNRLLSVSCKSAKLLNMYQALLEHGNKCTNVAQTLIKNFKELSNNPANQVLNPIDVSLRIGSFFNEGGWYQSCMELMAVTEELCSKLPQDNIIKKKLLECYHRKLYAEVAYKELKAAESSYTASQRIISELREDNDLPNLAAVYSNFAGFFYMKSDYSQAILWSQEALKCLHADVPKKIVIEVLRQASKSCIVKRNFNQAGFLIKQAVNLAKRMYKRDDHPHYADTMSDYGFYLLNSDHTEKSVHIYEKALEIMKSVFKKYNINVALAHEDLAYVLYVHEYSSGSFTSAREHAEMALKIMNRILSSEHLLMASAKRVKALILEEIALDLENLDLQESYLKEAEKLHKEALDSSLTTFGEKNVLTAKQYGNLGRLYQSMKKFVEAEEMHLKAIAIKEELLGEFDYEVALSVGHLASLYNYQMYRYKDAEKLYKRSIDISVSLLGESYSGLEYDYKGLTHVYRRLKRTKDVRLYEQKMAHWETLRGQQKVEKDNDDILPIDQIQHIYFQMC